MNEEKNIHRAEWSGILRTGGGLAGFLLVLAIAIAVNVTISHLNVRKDLTEEKLYTLSDGTRRVLDKLPAKVTLKFYFSGSSPEIPIGVKNFASRIEDLLREYEIAGKGKIAVEKYDPKPDSDAEDWARRYGVAGQQLGMGGPTLFLGLVAESGDIHEAIPVFDPRNENLLEYAVTRVISKTANPGKAIVGVMSGLEVLGTPGDNPFLVRDPENAAKAEPKQPWIVFQALRQDYNVRKVEQTTEAIDPDMDVLVLAHPRELSDRTLYAIDQFVLRGGRLIAFIDPFCVAEMELQSAPNPYMTPSSARMDKLLAAWGVDFERDNVVADLESVTTLSGNGGTQEDSPVWLSLRSQRLNNKEMLTSQLQTLMLPFAGGFKINTASNLTVTTLISSSPTASLVPAFMARMGSAAIRRDFQSESKPIPIAVRVQGRMQSAFPAGRPPRSDGETNSADSAEEPAPAHLAESQDRSTVLLVGDADMLFDRFCVQQMNFFGMNTIQPINNNIDFFANAVDQMAGGADLVSVRSRGKIERPFEKVIKLQNKAQEQWLERERALEEKLRVTEKRLNELQSKKDEQQRYILSPEQQQEIETFKQQEMETKKELKLVRRRLREDIERLGMWLKFANILLVPLFVGVSGISFWLYRRRKARR